MIDNYIPSREESSLSANLDYEYEKKLRAMFLFYGDKLEKYEREVLKQFLAVRNPSPHLFFAGLFHFSKVFFQRAQEALALDTYQDFVKFRNSFKSDEEIDVLFFRLLAEATQPKEKPLEKIVLPERKEKEKMWYNEAEAKKFGLAMERLEGNDDAHTLIRRVFERNDLHLDIESEADQDNFYTLWLTKVKNIPPPAVPNLDLWLALHSGKKYPYTDSYKDNGDYKFLKALRAHEMRRDEFNSLPRFDAAETLLVETWHEADYLLESRPPVVESPLLKALGAPWKSVYDQISHIEILDLLWENWRGKTRKFKTKSDPHKEVLDRLGLGEEFYIRLIAYDEYLRLCAKYKWGIKRQFTLLSDTRTVPKDEVPDRYVAHTGNIHAGGVQGVEFAEQTSTVKMAAPRLVIAKAPHGVSFEE